ncbi:DUF2752 domain-containing protein [soil metagenome]
MTAETFKSSTTERLLAAAGIVSAVGGAAFVTFFNPTTAGFYPVCPLFQTTGFACPGCGLTRGFHALFHGEVLTAIGFNAMLPLWAFIFSYLFFAMFVIAVRGRAPKLEVFKPQYIWGFFILALVFAVVRNLPYYPFTLLYP